jgi:hypothetical protein
MEFLISLIFLVHLNLPFDDAMDKIGEQI